MDRLDFWRLCDELSVMQAALLIAGVDPSGEDGAYCENWQPHERPVGYEAAKTAIGNALRSGKISGALIPFYEYDINGNIIGEVPDTIDIKLSRVDVDSLREWLISRGIRTGFFSPVKVDTPDYLDPEHNRYSAKLAAAVQAWMAMEDSNLLSGKAPRDAIVSWLETRYRDLGLVWNGDINRTGIEEVSKVVNWKPTGGAPKTPGE